MKNWNARLALAGLLVVAAGGALAEVTVKFSNQQNYSNLTSDAQFRQFVFDDLTAYFDKLGAKLPAGSDLHIDVLDLKMAGPMTATSRGSEAPRIAPGELYWPHMRVRYSVTQGDKVVVEGDDQLTDPDYVDRVRRVATSLPAEKLMIEQWFKDKVVPPTLAAR